MNSKKIYNPPRYSWGGGIAIGGILGGYLGYKIGRARPQKFGFDTEKKIGKGIKKTFSKKKYAHGGGVGYKPMDRYDRIKYFMNNLGFEVDDIQPTDTSVGIFDGWVVFKKRNDKKEVYYSISYDNLWYYMHHNGTKEDVLNNSEVVDDDFFAEGGMTEHGLRVGDKIMGESKDLNSVFVKNNDQWNSVFLDKGIRYEKGGSTYSKGGGINDEWNYRVVVPSGYSGYSAWYGNDKKEAYQKFKEIANNYPNDIVHLTGDLEYKEVISESHNGEVPSYSEIDWSGEDYTYSKGGGIELMEYDVHSAHDNTYLGTIQVGKNADRKIAQQKANKRFGNPLLKVKIKKKGVKSYAKGGGIIRRELGYVTLDDGNLYRKVEMVKVDKSRNPTNKTYIEYIKVYKDDSTYKEGGGVNDFGIGDKVMYDTYRDGTREGEILREIDDKHFEIGSGFGVSMVHKDKIIGYAPKRMFGLFEQGGNIDDIVAG